jgi:hypothetical protein
MSGGTIPSVVEELLLFFQRGFFRFFWRSLLRVAEKIKV